VIWMRQRLLGLEQQSGERLATALLDLKQVWGPVSLRAWKEILQAHLVSGDNDFLSLAHKIWFRGLNRTRLKLL
jgi:hypothetical protein